MTAMIAYCGLDCSQCPTYLATRNNNYEEKVKVAQEWSQLYKSDLKPEDINCDGCTQNTGNVFGHCRVCTLRSCGQDKQVVTCAHCAGYPCQELTSFTDVVPHAKLALEKIRKNLKS